MGNDNKRINNGTRDVSPCAFCKPEDKYTACHDTCEKYKKWRANLDAIKKKRPEYHKLMNQVDHTWKGVNGK